MLLEAESVVMIHCGHTSEQDGVFALSARVRVEYPVGGVMPHSKASCTASECIGVW